MRRRDKEQVFCQELTDCPEGFSLNERIAVVRDLNAKVGVLVYGILRLWEMSCINNSEQKDSLFSDIDLSEPMTVVTHLSLTKAAMTVIVAMKNEKGNNCILNIASLIYFIYFDFILSTFITMFCLQIFVIKPWVIALYK